MSLGSSTKPSPSSAPRSSELRQLAHGIRPSCLDDGLAPALSQLVSTTHLPIVLRVSATDLDQDVETTAYYVAAEAITNAVKHAEATTITLDVAVVAGQLHVRVVDDGNGHAALRGRVGARRPRRPGRRTRWAAVHRESTRCRHHHRSGAAVRIVIAEDSTLFREGLASLLTDAGHEIVARVPDATTLMDAVRDQRPDLAIVDVRMPPDHTDDGARAAMALRAAHPRLGILLLSQHIETTHSVHLVTTGAFGYLLKDRVLDVDDFLDALQRVASGGSALDPEVVTRLISMNSAHEPLHALTTREREVLALMAQGHTNAAIARRLFLSQRTVETHIAGLMAKLGIEPDTDGHRRVLAVLAFLDAQTQEW